MTRPKSKILRTGTRKSSRIQQQLAGTLNLIYYTASLNVPKSGSCSPELLESCSTAVLEPEASDSTPLNVDYKKFSSKFGGRKQKSTTKKCSTARKPPNSELASVENTQHSAETDRDRILKSFSTTNPSVPFPITKTKTSTAKKSASLTTLPGHKQTVVENIQQTAESDKKRISKSFSTTKSCVPLIVTKQKTSVAKKSLTELPEHELCVVGNEQQFAENDEKRILRSFFTTNLSVVSVNEAKIQKSIARKCSPSPTLSDQKKSAVEDEPQSAKSNKRIVRSFPTKISLIPSFDETVTSLPNRSALSSNNNSVRSCPIGRSPRRNKSKISKRLSSYHPLKGLNISKITPVKKLEKTSASPTVLNSVMNSMEQSSKETKKEPRQKSDVTRPGNANLCADKPDEEPFTENCVNPPQLIRVNKMRPKKFDESLELMNIPPTLTPITDMFEKKTEESPYLKNNEMPPILTPIADQFAERTDELPDPKCHAFPSSLITIKSSEKMKKEHSRKAARTSVPTSTKKSPKKQENKISSLLTEIPQSSADNKKLPNKISLATLPTSSKEIKKSDARELKKLIGNQEASKATISTSITVPESVEKLSSTTGNEWFCSLFDTEKLSLNRIGCFKEDYTVSSVYENTYIDRRPLVTQVADLCSLLDDCKVTDSEHVADFKCQNFSFSSLTLESTTFEKLPRFESKAENSKWQASWSETNSDVNYYFSQQSSMTSSLNWSQTSRNYIDDLDLQSIVRGVTKIARRLPCYTPLDENWYDGFDRWAD